MLHCIEEKVTYINFTQNVIFFYIFKENKGGTVNPV
jgi:hypothetical protein